MTSILWQVWALLGRSAASAPLWHLLSRREGLDDLSHPYPLGMLYQDHLLATEIEVSYQRTENLRKLAGRVTGLKT